MSGHAKTATATGRRRSSTKQRNTMRTDSRDRFGTPLEQRFSKAEFAEMMRQADLKEITFSENAPYWTAVGYKR